MKPCKSNLEDLRLALVIALLSLLLNLQTSTCWALKTPTISATSTTTPPLLDVPTYSMATCNAKGKTNMNILTYATPVCIRPDRVWSLGLYKETLSCENFLQKKSCILQLLTEQHIPLVKVLGGSSGKDRDKQEECQRLGFTWGHLPGVVEGEESSTSAPMVLPGCAYYLKLTAIGDPVDCGCHCSVLCKVDAMFVSDPTKTSYVSTARLRDLGVITEQGRVAE